MNILWTILIGFVVGLIARFVTPGKDAHGLIITTLLGIGGAMLASFAGQALGLYAAGQPAGWIASVLGAVAILLIARLIRKKGA